MKDLKDLEYFRKIESKKLDTTKINLKLKSVLITGAGGSIGSELSRQLVSKQCKRIYLLDNCEFNLFSIYEEIKNEKPEIIPILIDLVDEKAIDSFLKNNTIEAVYHVAAYKHVNLLQMNKYSAIRNNIVGTKNLIEGIIDKVDFFTQVSTDKAVNPINIMGTTKRISEMLTLDFARRSKKTIFNIVRFGNVLHSSGSVIPIFKDQIQNTGIITVTDAKATRYFMTISEAVNLVINSAQIKKNKEILVLDMGEPVKIIDLALNMIKLAGKKPTYGIPRKNEVKIEFIGLRDGEKECEELSYNELENTILKGILRSKERTDYKEEVKKVLQLLKELSWSNANETAKKLTAIIK